MGIPFNARLLQTDGNPVISQNQKGAVALANLIQSFDGDTALSDEQVLGYGQWLSLGPNKGAIPIAATTPAASSLIGVLPYINSGVIDVQGYQQRDGFYTNVPVMKDGIVWVESYGTVDLDSTLYLYTDPDDTDTYNRVRNGSDGTSIDISSIAKVVEVNNSDNLVCIHVRIL
jgi:hypothetical protein